MFRHLIILIILVSNYANAELQSKYEGFYNITDVPEIQNPEKVRKAFYKVIIGPVSYGTAFSISSKSYLLTNVHNVTRCLRDHGMVETGYDGSKGPLECSSLSVLSSDGHDMGRVFLLGSNPRHNNFGYDFAVLSVDKSVASFLSFRDDNDPVLPSEELYIVGFPGQTYRSKVELNGLKTAVTVAIDNIFGFEEYLSGVEPGKVASEEMFTKWIHDFFAPTQPLLPASNFFAESLLGLKYDLHNYQNIDSTNYLRRLDHYINILKRDAYVLFQNLQRGIRLRDDDLPGFVYPNASNTLKASYARFGRWEGKELVVKGDVTPGSSGSAILDSVGSILGIVFALGNLEEDSTEACVLDFILTNSESVSYSFCNKMAPYSVPTRTVQQKLKDWKISL